MAVVGVDMIFLLSCRCRENHLWRQRRRARAEGEGEGEEGRFDDGGKAEGRWFRRPSLCRCAGR